ncbi:MAG TPA: NAD(P)H-hydrate dehydratase [Flavobacterium sp.]|nr:NAD(P)H-hydrate dehydratase [Flavobacterium sp.]
MGKIQVTKERILKIYRPMAMQTHKGLQGHALIIGGSYGKIGSIVLASKACLKSGCGLVTAFVPKCGCAILQASFPEAMAIADENEKYLADIVFDIEPEAIAIGMGMGQEPETQNAFFRFLKANRKPLLIDADALNILAKNKEWLDLLPKNAILTPHKKKLERHIGSWETETEKFDKISGLARKHSIIFVVKGAPTLTVTASEIYENTTGNAALATAGSGDSLSGIITGLLAQGYQASDAAVLGAYLHGLTADIGSETCGCESFLASDIAANLGKAFLSLKIKNE